MKVAGFFLFLFFSAGTHVYAWLNHERLYHVKKEMNDPPEKLEEADTHFRNGNYADALSLYLELHNADKKNSYLSYKVGVCCMKIKKDDALYYLKKATNSVSPKFREGSFKEKKAPLIAYKILAQAYHQQLKLDKAINTYEKYKKILAKDPAGREEVSEIEREIEICNTAKALIASPKNVRIENLGQKVNSPYPDYSPVINGDQSVMIFTSRRPGNVGGKTYDHGKFFEDIYIASKEGAEWGEAKDIGPPINTIGNEASVGISADGQEILIYKDDNGDGNIYSTNLNGSKWSMPRKLNAYINSKYWEPSAFITPDGNTLYFVSDRPGGYGGRDIYKSHKDASGQWGKAINLGPVVNTKYDEEAPYLHPDGVTLFFASNGHKTMGGFDIFESTLQVDGTWSEPVNEGYPINSPDDDVFYIVSADKKTAYFTSYRDGGYGEKDNYRITFPEAKQTPLELLSGHVLDSNQVAAKDVKITVTDNETGEIVGVYHPNSETGKYLFFLKPGRSNNICYEADGYMFYSENRYFTNEADFNEIKKSVKLTPITIGAKVVLNNIFFDFDKATLRKSSNVELNKLDEFLTKNPDLSVEISGFTDSKGTEEYNNNLSLERAMAVANFLIEKGIAKERLIAAGHGKSDPMAPNVNPDGSDNPEGRQMNRRVELKITAVNKAVK